MDKQVEKLVARARCKDAAAFTDLQTVIEPHVRRVVRHILRNIGRRNRSEKLLVPSPSKSAATEQFIVSLIERAALVLVSDRSNDEGYRETVRPPSTYTPLGSTSTTVSRNSSGRNTI